MKFPTFTMLLACVTISFGLDGASAQQGPPIRPFVVGPIEIQLPAGWVMRPFSDRRHVIADPGSRVWTLEVS